MGLDMYLSLRKSEWKSEDAQYPEELKKFEEEISARNFTWETLTKTYQVGYWRKFNALHAWIVEHSGHGVDECQEIRLDDTDVEEIIDICEQILKDHSRAEELLPTASGFFFGTKEYSEWYFKDVEYTLDLMKKVLDAMVKNHYECIYNASW